MLALVAIASATPPNLVLVSVDGLRADRTGVYGASPSPTPGLDRLAASGLVCELALSQSNESLFSHTSLLTGRHPSEIASPDYTPTACRKARSCCPKFWPSTATTTPPS